MYALTGRGRRGTGTTAAPVHWFRDVSTGACFRPGCRQCGQQRRHVESAPEVHLGDLHDQLVAVPLDEAAHCGNARTACVRGVRSLEDRLDRLLLGGIDEAAGVDDEQVGAVGSGQLMPGGQQPRLERVGIGLVLRAARACG